MSQAVWTAVDDYLETRFIAADAALEQVMQTTRDAALPPHLAVSSLQGKFLQLLAQIRGAKTILEIGTLAGYSTIWLAGALPPDGKLISIEAVPTNVTLARKNIEFAGLSHLVDIYAGKALDLFAEIAVSGVPPFDFIFIDADKSGYRDYVDWALKLSRPGTVMILDNVIRGGGIVDFANTTRTMAGLREYFDHLAKQEKISSTTLQTVGSKGHDGFTLAVVR